jgi:hypothetical protein
MRWLPAYFSPIWSPLHTVLPKKTRAVWVRLEMTVIDSGQDAHATDQENRIKFNHRAMPAGRSRPDGLPQHPLDIL